MALRTLPRGGRMGTQGGRPRLTIRLCLAVCVFAALSLPNRLPADPPVKFSDPDVTAYVKKLGRFCDLYVAAARAAQHGDASRLRQMDAQIPQLQAQAVRMAEKLQPGETKAFTEYISQCGQTMMDAAYGLTLPPATPH